MILLLVQLNFQIAQPASVSTCLCMLATLSTCILKLSGNIFISQEENFLLIYYEAFQLIRHTNLWQPCRFS
ncbi:hypothetical protein EON65_44665 [archaeon]|nr:MAG: hypothetical protein EON65_44665 [archaeon]